MWKPLIACALSVAAAPVVAQDVPSPYESAITDHGQLQLDSTLARRRLQQARERQRGAPSVAVNARSRAICLDKKRMAARLGPAKGRQLYALCAQAGL